MVTLFHMKSMQSIHIALNNKTAGKLALERAPKKKTRLTFKEYIQCEREAMDFVAHSLSPLTREYLARIRNEIIEYHLRIKRDKSRGGDNTDVNQPITEGWCRT